MNFINKFDEEEYFGRQGLNELKELYPNYFKYELHFTTDSYSTYDAYWVILDENLSIKKRVIVEIKQRTEDYPEFILESKKYNALLKYRQDLFLTKDEMKILYINFTPSKTIIWDIDNVKIEIKTLKANKTTVDSRTNKINKGVIYLTTESGKVLPYILNRDNILKKQKINKIVETKTKELKNDLFKALFQ